MSFGPQVVMPGAFHYEAVNDGGTSLSGVHPGIFRQPVSPSPSASVYLGRSTGSLYSDPSTPGQNVKRKRQSLRESTPLNDWIMAGDTSLNTNSLTEGRKPDLGKRKISGGKRRYVLAGQINTPNTVATKEFGDSMEDSVYSDVDYRRALGSKRPHAEFESPLSNHTTADSNSERQNARQPGWSTFAIQTIGGVVGKVWQFCKAGAFAGFYAGGGKGYEMHPPAPASEQQHSQQTPSRPNGGQVWCNEHDIPTLPSYSGGFPQSNYSPYYYERETPEEPKAATPPLPAAKRRQIDNENHGHGASARDELRRNWVVVNEPAVEAKKQQQQKQQLRRPSSLASRAPTGHFNPQRSSAAVPRRSNLNLNLNNLTRPINRLDAPPPGTRFGSNRRSSSSRASVARAGAAPPAAPREPASYASPRSSASVAGAAAAATTVATAATPAPSLQYQNQNQNQLSPSRIPVPVSHGSRPSTAGSGSGRGIARPYSPAFRVGASPSPTRRGLSPFAKGGNSSSSHRRTQSAVPSPAPASAGAASSPNRMMTTMTTPLGARGGKKRDPAAAAAAGADLDLKKSSPRLDREAKKLAARQRQAEREADLRISDFNARLREMIRQGKEALGTSVEVDLLDAEEEDEDYDDNKNNNGIGVGNGYRDRYGDPWEDD